MPVRYDSTSDFDLDSANANPTGITFGNNKFWVADATDNKVYAYNADGSRDTASDFDLDSANANPTGITFGNNKFWVINTVSITGNRVYAYNADDSRDTASDFDLDSINTSPVGITFGNNKFWVVDSSDNKVYAYNADGSRDDDASDFDLDSANANPTGITFGNNKFWVVDSSDNKVYAYNADGSRDDDASDFDLDSANANPTGITFGNNKFWVINTINITDTKVYGYILLTRVAKSLTSKYSIRNLVTNSKKIIDVSTSTYDNKSFSVNSQETQPSALAFNNDLSKVYVVGFTTDTIYQYSLSTPGDISTATYDNKSFSVSSQEVIPTGLAFNNDLSKVYVVGFNTDKIYQYSLSTPGDISTATYDNKSFSVRSQESQPSDLAFNNDLSKVYVVGYATDTIHQYTLSTPGDISTATYDNKSFSVNSQDSNPSDLAFNNDLSKVYVVGIVNNKIHQYSLSTPGDISTATYDNKSFSVSSQESQPRDLAFNNDLSKVYVVGLTTAIIYQYSVSEVINHLTSQYKIVGRIGRSIISKFKIAGRIEKSLTSKYSIRNLTAKSLTSKYSIVGKVLKSVTSLYIIENLVRKSIASKYHIRESVEKSVTSKYTILGRIEKSLTSKYSIRNLTAKSLTSKYQIAGKVLKSVTSRYIIKNLVRKSIASKYHIRESVEKSVTSKYTILGRIEKSIASKYQILSRITKQVASKYTIEGFVTKILTSQYKIVGKVKKSLTSKYSIRNIVTNSEIIIDVSTAVYNNKSYSIGEFTAPTGCTFNRDMSKVWITGKDALFIYQYSLSTPGDITTATYDNKRIAVSAGTQGISFNGDYSKMYLINSTLDKIMQYSLTTPEDISTATLGSSYSVSSQEDGPRGIAVNSDVSKIWIVGSAEDTVFQYELSTPGNILTASYNNKSFAVNSQVGGFPQGVTFNVDMSRMWVSDSTNDAVYQYTLSTPGDVSTATYDNLSYSFGGVITNPTDIKFNPDFTAMYVTGQHTNRVFQFTIPESIQVLTSEYQIVSKVVKSVTSRYVIDGIVKRFVTSQYAIRNLTAKSLTSQYFIAGRITKSLTSQYKIVGRVAKSIISQYKIVERIKKQVTSKYTILGKVTKSVTSQYQITSKVLKSVTSRYAIERFVTNTITSQYKIISRIAKSLTSEYSIRNTVTNTQKILDISTATYDNESYSIGEFTSPTGCTFNRDMSKMWVVGKDDLFAYQYTLSTPGDITTATYDNKKIGVAQGTQGLSFNADYTKMYLVNSSLDTIIQYDLSTAEDISTATQISSYSVSSQEDGPRGIAVNGDVSKIWVVGSAEDTVFQYSLSTPGDLSTISYNNKSFPINSQDNFPQGITVNESETMMWLAGSSNDGIHQYTLSTPGDVSTASYDGLFYSLSGISTNPTDVKFNPDFTAMYVTGQHTNKVFQFAIPESIQALASIYQITGRVLKSITSRYVIDGFVSRFITSQYKITGRIKKQVTSRYSIFGMVAKSITSRYQIASKVAKSITSRYAIDGTVKRFITSQYKITGRIKKSITSKYLIRGLTSKSITSRYDIKNSIAKSLTSRYEILSKLSKSITSRYAITGKVIKTVNSEYSVRNLAAKSITSQYSITARISKSLDSQYAIFARVAKSVTSQYVIREAISKTLNSKYSIIGRAIHIIRSKYYVGDVELPISGTFKLLTTVKSFKLITNKATRDNR